MALRFDVVGDRLTIAQTRRGVRVALWLVVLSLGVGLVLQLIPRDRRVTVTCSRAEQQCTVRRGGKDHRIALAAITGVQLDDGSLKLARTGDVPYHLCSAPRSELTSAADALTGFLKDPAQPRVTTACESTHDGRMPLTGLLAGLAGSLLIVVILGLFRVDAHTIVDRATGTIAMRGSAWPFRSWSVERRLSEVDRVTVRRIYVGRGQYMRLVDVRFTDGTSARAMSPAAYVVTTLDERVATLRDFVGKPE